MKAQTLNHKQITMITSILVAVVMSLFTSSVFAQNSNDKKYENYGNNLLGIAGFQLKYPDLVFDYNYDMNGNLTSITIKGMDNPADKDEIIKELKAIHDTRNELLYAKDNNGVYYRAEDRPRYPGGKLELRRDLQSHVEYPEEAKKQDVEGVVMLKFYVDRYGKVRDLEAFDNIKGPEWVVNQMEKAAKTGFEEINQDWIPGEIDGVAVPTWVMVPVRFEEKLPTSLQLLM